MKNRFSSRRDEDKGSRQFRLLTMHGLKTLAVICAITLTLTLAVEAGLFLAWKATNSSKFDTLYRNSLYFPKARVANQEYPDNPAGVLKIATFGGSSAAGAAAERNFANILSFELERHPNAGKVYVRNYAEGGAPFHLFQAELAKRLIPFYDVIVIYAGNNEWVPPYFKRGGLDVVGIRETKNPWPSWRAKIERAVAEVRHNLGVIGFLRRHSRLFAVAWKASLKLSEFLTTRGVVGKTVSGILHDSNARRPPATATKKTLSHEEIEGFRKNYADDLTDVRQIARRYGALVVVVGASGDETWPPHFSQRPSRFDDSSTKELDRVLAIAGTRLEEGKIQTIRQVLSPWIARTPEHAYLNYILGRVALATGNFKDAWAHFEKAIDEDGYPMRANSATRQASAALADEKFIYISHVETTRRLYEEGLTARDLWSDIVHPSTLNHALIAREVLCVIATVGRAFGTDRFCGKVNASDAFALRRRYFTEMNIRPEETAREYEDVYRWGVLVSRISAHPKAYFAAADWALDAMHDDAGRNESSRATLHIRRALLRALMERPCAEVAKHVVAAIAADPIRAGEVLRNDLLAQAGLDTVSVLKSTGVIVEMKNRALVAQERCSSPVSVQ